jgi:GSCFA family
VSHPYKGLPDDRFWGKDPGIGDARLLDPLGPPPFAITPQHRIVTAGSCFAQHVARRLSEAGFNHHVTERAHPVIPARVALAHHYGVYSARYGNIYTARQLHQLIDRAFDRFVPIEAAWAAADGEGVVDPFRPRIQPGGFVSESELRLDRARHLACVRDALQTMDVFVFTLGLTEAWEDRRDGAIFPLAPGVAGGLYDSSQVAFRNFDEVESYEDLRAAITRIRAVNPRVRVVLTVSPVPLNATFEDRHVLLSSTWSKSVLRVAAERATREFADTVYFPSYEIVTAPQVRGRYFAADCREVTAEGVDHVMRLFLKHFAGIAPGSRAQPDRDDTSGPDSHLSRMRGLIDAFCDEEAIDNG